MKKKILFVMYSLTGGGAEKAMVNLLNMIDYDKYDVTLQLFENRGINLEYLPKQVRLLPALKDKTWLLSNGSDFIKNALKYVKPILLTKRLFTSFKIHRENINPRYSAILSWNAIKKSFKTENETYDIAVAYIQNLPIYYVLDCVKANKKIGWMHTDYSKTDVIPKDLVEPYFKRLDAFVTVSKKCVDSLKEAFPNLDNIHLLHNLNSINLIEALSKRDSADEIDSNIPSILSIGRLCETKGFDLAIEAASIMKKANIPFKWYIMGSGPLENELKAMVMNLKLENEVIFLGLKTNPYPYIKKATIIAQTSRYEGKSVVLDEAKILKKPILVTNYDSAKDQITNGQDGYIVDINTESIADGIIDLLSNSEKRDKIVEGLGSFEEEQNYWLNKHYEIFEGEL